MEAFSVVLSDFHFLGNAIDYFSAQKMEAALCLLDSFGTAKTYLCNAASRFSLRVTLEYDMADLLIGASLQVLIYRTKIFYLRGTWLV